MVLEMCCTARGSVMMADWKTATGIRSTWQRVSAMTSAIVFSPLINAISPNVSPTWKTPDHLALAAVAEHGDRQVALEQNAQEVGVLAEFDDGFVGFVRDDTRLLHQLVEAIVGEMLAEADSLLQELDKCGMFHDALRVVCSMLRPFEPRQALR